MLNRKLTAAEFWTVFSKDYDTYMVSQTDRISFKIDDLYKFMDAYASQPSKNNASFLPKCTRVEVIDKNGRAYVNWKPTNKVQTQMQDDNKTLKVFIT